MPSYSGVTIVGHLGRDAETKDVSGKDVTEFSVAVSTKRKGEEATSWYRCSMWGRSNLAQYLTKGKLVMIEGELQPREYRNKQDELRTSLDVRVGSVVLLGGGGEKRQEPAQTEQDYGDEPPF